MITNADHRYNRPDDYALCGGDHSAFGDQSLGQKWKPNCQESVDADGCNEEDTAVHVGVLGAQQECTQKARLNWTEGLQDPEGKNKNGQEIGSQQVEHVDVRFCPALDATEDVQSPYVEEKAHCEDRYVGYTFEEIERCLCVVPR